MNSAELKRAKRAIRTEARAARDALAPDVRARCSLLIRDRFLELPELETVRTVMLFWSFGSEVDTAPLVRSLVERGVKVALPRIVGGELEPRTYRPGDPVTETSFGACEPSGGEVLDASTLDVVVTPGVVFDRAGRRVGYGGGYYDRFLPRTRPDSLRIGVAFDVQLVDGDLPGGHFDLPVHAIVTGSEVVRCRPGG
jgi:5-formyltetrahydrofolate cyclo-ligase